MKNLLAPLLLFGLSLLFSNCADESKPNHQFFPDMYEPVGYETYQESSAFPNNSVAQHPVKGTIKRGYTPYGFQDTSEDFERAKATNKNPFTDLTLDDGKNLYAIYCALCHGDKGDGNGILVKNEKFLGVPNYKDRELTEGGIYHTIYYGLNTMGSHANQLSHKERWQVTEYILKLKNDL